MSNEQSAIYFRDSLLGVLKELEPKELHSSLMKGYERTAVKVRQTALAGLHGINIDVQGDRTDWDNSLRTHIYSGGGGFLLTVRGRSGKRGSGEGEKSMHKNRFFGKYKRKLPILQWIEHGTKERKTKGFTRKQHSTGHINGQHFLRGMEPRLVQIVETETMKDLNSVLEDVAKRKS